KPPPPSRDRNRIQQCTVVKCNKSIRGGKMNRHLREVHQFSDLDIQRHNQARRSDKSSSKNPLKMCPLCGRPQANLGRHLQSSTLPDHSLRKDSEAYLELMKTSVPFGAVKDNHSGTTKEKSEKRKQY
ncbi:hypothetical protein AC249_AIPGENE12581, partial [Exaiptasia diaphana]